MSLVTFFYGYHCIFTCKTQSWFWISPCCYNEDLFCFENILRVCGMLAAYSTILLFQLQSSHLSKRVASYAHKKKTTDAKGGDIPFKQA